MTEQEIIKHLKCGIDKRKYPFQIPNAFIYKHECDYWVMDQNGITREFEIKVSRADYLKDSEKEKHSKTDGANYFYYVTPRHLIKPEEVDKRYGLLYVLDCGHIEFVKKPVKLHDRLFADWKMLANKLYWRFRSLWAEKLQSKEINRDEFYEGLALDEFEKQS